MKNKKLPETVTNAWFLLSQGTTYYIHVVYILFSLIRPRQTAPIY